MFDTYSIFLYVIKNNFDLLQLPNRVRKEKLLRHVVKKSHIAPLLYQMFVARVIQNKIFITRECTCAKQKLGGTQ